MRQVGPPIGKTYLRTDAWGDTDDIIRTIIEADALAPPFTSDFALSIQGDTIDDTCYNLWAWVRKNITYREDPDGRQDIQLPGALVAHGYGDCKSMGVFCASVLKNLYGNIYRYRFISQDPQSDLHHVYLVVTDERGADIILDCVESHYDYEVPHVKYKDMIAKSKIAGPFTASTGKTIMTAAGSGVLSQIEKQQANTQQLPTNQTADNATAPPQNNTTMYVGIGLALLLAYYLLSD